MYTDLLTKIKNAQAARKEFLKTFYSDADAATAEFLTRHNYIDGAVKKGRLPKRIIEIKLKYDNNKGAISGLKFLSKPSRRLYAGYRDFRAVKQGYGLLVVSTSKGIMTGAEARKLKLGGELLFEIW